MSGTINTYYHLNKCEVDVTEAIQHNNNNFWLRHISADVWRHLFGRFFLEFEDLKNCNVTCKKWNQILNSPQFTNILLGRTRIPGVLAEVGFRTYCLWQRSQNHIFAVDVSGSMEPRKENGRLQRAFRKINEIAQQVFTKTRRYVQVIMFSEEYVSSRINPIGENSIDALNEALKLRPKRIIQTDFCPFMQEIFKGHCMQNEPRFEGDIPLPLMVPTATHVYILSDFETNFNSDLDGKIERFNEEKNVPPIHFHCYRFSDTRQSINFLRTFREKDSPRNKIRVETIDVQDQKKQLDELDELINDLSISDSESEEVEDNFFDLFDNYDD